MGALVGEHFGNRVRLITVRESIDETLDLPNYHIILDALKPGDHLKLLYIDDGLYSGSQISANVRVDEYANLLKAIEDRGATADLEIIIHSYTESGVSRIKSEMAGEDSTPVPFSSKNIKVNFNVRHKMKTMEEVITDFISSKSVEQQKILWQTLNEIFTIRGIDRFKLLTRKPMLLMPHKIPDGMSFFRNLKG